jgi:S-disulfanyl-L-cysteine oxidoreductase SoxD
MSDRFMVLVLAKKKQCSSCCSKIIFLFFSATCFSQLADALPWDIDMYRQESLKSNEVNRAPVKGTVAVGRKPFSMSVAEAEKNLKNPVALSFNSAWRGQRLFNSNCVPCHGVTGRGDGEVSKSLVGVPNILTDLYKQRTDGRIFAIIHHGQNAMPRYGFKFSEDEKWDIVNYVRFLQGAEVQGLKRPE